MEKLTLTIDEAGKTLGLSRASAYKAVHDGSIPSIRLGRRLLVPIGQLERMLNGKKDGMTDDKPAGS